MLSETSLCPAADQVVCRNCVNEGRANEMQSMLEASMGHINDEERAVLESVRRDSLLSLESADEFERNQGVSERAAHRVVAVVGSWLFAMLILLFIIIWLLVNFVGWRSMKGTGATQRSSTSALGLAGIIT